VSHARNLPVTYSLLVSQRVLLESYDRVRVASSVELLYLMRRFCKLLVLRFVFENVVNLLCLHGAFHCGFASIAAFFLTESVIFQNVDLWRPCLRGGPELVNVNET